LAGDTPSAQLSNDEPTEDCNAPAPSQVIWYVTNLIPAGFMRFRQPPVLVSKWLAGFANCTPTQRPTSLSKTPAASQ